MKIRPLYPSETDQSSDNCFGFCDPACPYNCYDYLLSPPPPPAEDLSGGQHRISPYLIVAVSLLAGFFIAVTYYVIFSKSHHLWLCRRRSSSGNDENRQFVDENRVDHAIWYIATVGLHQSIINSITVWRYNKDEGLVESTECSVCLNEFQDRETLRLLPKCNHAFHILCIDTWLRSHTNCPLCRAGIILDAGNAPTAVPSSQNPSNGALVLENQREYYWNNGETEEVGESEDGGGKEGESLLGIRDRESARIKRSVSMNLTAAGLKDSEKRCSNSSIDRYLHLSPVPMKRSSSSCGRLSFSSRRRTATASQLEFDFPFSFCFITSEKPRKC